MKINWKNKEERAEYDRLRNKNLQPSYKIKKQQQSKEWRENNKEKVKQLNHFHSSIRKEKKYEKRKEELNYENFEWFLIPNTKKKYYINRDGLIIDEHFKIMKISETKNGYFFVSLDGKKIMYHRAIAFVFIPNPNNKPEINHKDGNKSNNSIDNLEWVTRSENVKHSFEVLKKKSNLIGWKKK
jgi:hypothetical protein